MWLELDSKGRFVNQTPVKNLQLSKIASYSEDTIKDVYLTNLRTALDLLKRAREAGIHFVRLSSALFPLWDKVPRYLWDNDEVVQAAEAVGDYALQHRMRVNTHPSQYFVLSSDKAHVVDTAVKELNFQGWLFDIMGFPQTPYYNINIHGGKKDRADALVVGIERLDDAARKRLTLENCEFAYSVDKLMPVAQRTNVPIVADVHHHSINPGALSVKNALLAAFSTWPLEVRPTTHLSNCRPGFEEATPGKRRVHSDYIREFEPTLLQFHAEGRTDVEIEAKAKNLTIKLLMEDQSASLQTEQ